MKFSFVLLLFHVTWICNGYKILIFSPTNSRSHMISNGRIADTLAKDGHEVVSRLNLTIFSIEVKNEYVMTLKTLSNATYVL